MVRNASAHSFNLGRHVEGGFDHRPRRTHPAFENDSRRTHARIGRQRQAPAAANFQPPAGRRTFGRQDAEICGSTLSARPPQKIHAQRKPARHWYLRRIASCLHFRNLKAMKSALRFSKASGSTRRKVELIIQRGWRPGLKISDVLKRRTRQAGAR